MAIVIIAVIVVIVVVVTVIVVAIVVMMITVVVDVVVDVVVGRGLVNGPSSDQILEEIEHQHMIKTNTNIIINLVN